MDLPDDLPMDLPDDLFMDRDGLVEGLPADGLFEGKVVGRPGLAVGFEGLGLLDGL